MIIERQGDSNWHIVDRRVESETVTVTRITSYQLAHDIASHTTDMHKTTATKRQVAMKTGSNDSYLKMNYYAVNPRTTRHQKVLSSGMVSESVCCLDREDGSSFG